MPIPSPLLWRGSNTILGERVATALVRLQFLMDVDPVLFGRVDVPEKRDI